MKKIEFVDIRDLKVCVNTILNTFYTHSLTLHAVNSQSTNRMQKAVDRYVSDLNKFFDETIKGYAQVLFWYLVIICGGEVRRLDANNYLNLWQRIFKKLRISKPLSNAQIQVELSNIVPFEKERGACYTSLAIYLKTASKAEIQRLLNLLESSFKKGAWDNSHIGGPQWGKITEVAQKYWDSESDTLIFLDTVFTLRHHGNALFDKIKGFYRHTSEALLQDQLDIQNSAKSMTDLITSLSEIHPYWEPGLIHLLRRGVTFGYWNDDLVAKCQGKYAIEKGETS